MIAARSKGPVSVKREAVALNHVRRIFGSVDRAFLVRGWLLGFVFLAFYLLVLHGAPAIVTVVFVLNTILFPFSKLVWNATRGFVIGDTVLILPAVLLFGLKFFVNVHLWGFSFLVAPFGIAWVWHQGGRG